MNFISKKAKIGNYVRMHSSAQINQFSKIGNFVWIFPYVIFINDPHPPSDGFTKGPIISDFAVLGAGSIIFPGIKVGKGSLVGAGCVLKINLPDEQITVGTS